MIDEVKYAFTNMCIGFIFKVINWDLDIKIELTREKKNIMYPSIHGDAIC